MSQRLRTVLEQRRFLGADGYVFGTEDGRTDLSRGEQLRQRAAMAGEKERAKRAAFESLLARKIAEELVAQLRKGGRSGGR